MGRIEEIKKIIEEINCDDKDTIREFLKAYVDQLKAEISDFLIKHPEHALKVALILLNISSSHLLKELEKEFGVEE